MTVYCYDCDRKFGIFCSELTMILSIFGCKKLTAILSVTQQVKG